MLPSNADSSVTNDDRRFGRLVALAAGLSAILIVFIALFLLKESWPVIASGGWLRFFTDEGWYPLSGEYSLMPMLIASLAVGTGAILLAAPLGLMCAVFSVFYAHPVIVDWFRRLLALMAGVPSVVYGFWGLTVLVPLIASWEPPGTSLLTAILILTLMIVPTVALISQAALSAVPQAYLLGASALGLTRKGIILKVAIPAARSEIAAGILLAVARALGETMAVLMVAGNVVQTPTSLFDPIRALTANMALEMAYATGDHRAGLFVSGLLLTALIAVLAMLAYRFGRNHAHA